MDTISRERSRVRLGPVAALSLFLLLTNAIPSGAQIGSESFQNIGGSLMQISIGADGSVWGINASQQIFNYNSANGQWTNVPGSLKVIAAGSADAVWGLNYANQIYRYNSSSGGWLYVAGELNQIAVGADGAVWGINYLGNVYFYNGSGWTQLSGTMSAISVGSAGAVYALDSDGAIYWYNPGTGLFQQLTGTTGFTQLSAAADGDLWATKSGVAYHYNVLHATMDATTGASINQVMAGSGAAVFGLDAAEDTFQWDATSQTWVQLPGNLASIAVGANGTMWGVNSAQEIYELLGAPKRSYQTLSSIAGANLDQISVGADGAVWGVSSNTVEFFDRGTQTFEAVPGAPIMAQVSVGAGANVWGVDGSGNIYQYDASAQTWNSIPGQLSSVQVGADGSVWGISATGQTYTYQSTTSSWNQIPGQLGRLSVGADGTTAATTDSYALFTVSGTLANRGSGLSGLITIDTTKGFVTWTDLSVYGAPFTLATQEVDHVAAGKYYEIDTELAQSKYTFALCLDTASLVGYTGGPICGGTGVNCGNVGSTVFDPSGSEVDYVTGSASLTLLTPDETQLWGINSDQQIYRFNFSTQSWVNVPGSLKQISVGNVNNVWGVNDAGQVYYYDSATQNWVQIPRASLTQVAVGFDGSVWGVNAGGSLYQWNGTAKSFNFVGANVTDVLVGNAANVWAVNATTGAVYLWF